MRGAPLFALALSACASAPPPAAAPAAPPALQLTYRLEFQGDAVAVDVRWSAPTAAPAVWSAPGGPEVDGLPLELETLRGASSLEIRDLAQGVLVPAGTSALRYVYPLDELRRGGLKSGTGGDGGYVISPRCYLLAPEELPAEARVRLEADPAQCLLPWDLDQGAARILGRDLRRHGFHTFGARRTTLRNAQGRLELAILPGGDPARDARFVAWIEQAWEELLGCAPRYGAPRLCLTLVPRPGGQVGFGQLLRSRPPSIAIYVGEDADARELDGDWVAVHELSHSLHPQFWPQVTWLTEGLATYYQIVARIRSGRLTPAQAWSQLVRGTRSGQRQAAGGDLAQLSRDMHRSHRYHSVYWGGALLVLELDLAIRGATGDRATLDHVLASLCQRGPQSNLAAFASEVDRVAGRPVYAEVARRHLEGPCLTQREVVLRRLGIEPARGRAVALRESTARRALESRSTW